VSDEPEPAGRIERQEAVAFALDLLERLPANQREALVLKFQHGLRYREVPSGAHRASREFERS
jgi:DNA-directed RNA polymerase specialized sigma24 family protein